MPNSVSQVHTAEGRKGSVWVEPLGMLQKAGCTPASRFSQVVVHGAEISRIHTCCVTIMRYFLWVPLQLGYSKLWCDESKSIPLHPQGQNVTISPPVEPNL